MYSMTVSDRYTASHEREYVDCPSCGAKDIPYPIHSGEDIECPKCYVAPEEMGLAERTEMYINQGDTEEGAYVSACQWKGINPYPKRY